MGGVRKWRRTSLNAPETYLSKGLRQVARVCNRKPLVDLVDDRAAERGQQAEYEELDHKRVRKAEADRHRRLTEHGCKREAEHCPEAEDEKAGGDALQDHLDIWEGDWFAVNADDDQAGCRIDCEKCDDHPQPEHGQRRQLADEHPRPAVPLWEQGLDRAPAVFAALNEHAHD